MGAQTKNLAVLRAFLEKPGREQAWGRGYSALGHPAADAALRGGLRRGVLHEVFAHHAGEEAAASGFALALAARLLTGNKWLLWIRQDFSTQEAGEIYADALPEFGIDPARLLSFHAPDGVSALRAAGEGLACKALAAVIVEPWGEAGIFDLVASRKLTLAAQQHGVTAIALRFAATPEPSAAQTRWLIRAAASPRNREDWGKPAFEAALLRNRHGYCGSWVMEWDGKNGRFRKTDLRAVAAAAADGPAEAAMESLRQAG